MKVFHFRYLRGYGPDEVEYYHQDADRQAVRVRVGDTEVRDPWPWDLDHADEIKGPVDWCSICRERRAPTPMRTYSTPFAGGFVAKCPRCGQVCAYWDEEDLTEDGKLLCFHEGTEFETPDE